jgi:hypothetical protein
MDIKKIDKMLVPKPILGVTKQYGVMGLVLGKELHARLTKYCTKVNIHKSKVIRALIISYLNEKESK